MSRFQKGESGNPKGRPVGRGLQARLRTAVGDRFDERVHVVLDAALAGDMAAARMPRKRPWRRSSMPISVIKGGRSLIPNYEANALGLRATRIIGSKTGV